MTAATTIDVDPSPQPARLRPLKIAALLAVVTTEIYVNSLAAPFLFDDWLFIGQDGAIRKAWDWDSWQYLNRAFATWTLQWNFEVGKGFYPWQYRLTNIAIHIATGLTLFGLVRRTLLLPGLCQETDLPSDVGSTRKATEGVPYSGSANSERADWLAAAVALLWLVHPLQTEAVTYVVQRYESLMALGFLLTLYFAVRGSQSARPRDWYIAAVVACFLGALSKEVIAVAPLVVLLYDRAFLSGSFAKAWRGRWPLYAGLMIPTLFLFVVTRHSFIGDDTGAAGFGMKDISAWEYLCSQPAVILHYLRLTFWPDKLILDYGWPVAESPLAIYGLGALVLLLVGISLWASRQHPQLGFVGLAFFLVLAPTSSIIPIKDLAFEHRMYLPLAAVIILTVLAVEKILARLHLPEAWQGHAALLLLALAAGGLSLRTILRNRDYHDSIAIWRQCIENNPSHPRPYRVLADMYLERDPAVAIEFYETALARNPKIYWLWVDLGNAQLKRKNLAAATEAYETAAGLEPKLKEAQINLSRIRMRAGDYAGAIAAAKAAVEAQPGDAAALKQLAWLLATADDPAVRNGQQALAILAKISQDANKIDIQYCEVLSAAHAEAGDYDQAVAVAERALAEARKIKSRRVEEFAERVELYRARQPLRMKAEASSLARNAGASGG
jgi:tetratricopeptide (TPR) repeat protein